MKLHPVSWSGVRTSFHEANWRCFLAALLYITRGIASGQSMSFAGGQLTTPANSKTFWALSMMVTNVSVLL
jgi:hypothetical protein